MAYSYDDTLRVQYVISSTAASTVPVSMVAEGGKRKLEGSVVLGLAGIGSTAGPLTIKIGDGTIVDRYGTFTATVVNGAPLDGTLVLTEEGYHMGVSNSATTPQTAVFTPSGTGTVTGMVAIVGFY